MTNTILLPEAEMIPAFVPHAVFDVHLDCIRVLIRDASVTEIRCDEYVTVYRDNFPTDFSSEYVGFTLKGVNHLLHELGMEFDRSYKVSEILDAIVKQRPASLMAVIFGLIKVPLAAAADCEVRISDRAA